jgi:CheY-like chemotaxis protein
MAGLEPPVGKVLVVNDIQHNRRVIEARLEAEGPSRGAMGSDMRRRQLEETRP